MNLNSNNINIYELHSRNLCKWHIGERVASCRTILFQRALLFKRKGSSYDVGFFKLKVANLVAINRNRGEQQEFCFNKFQKKFYHFNRHELGLLT